MIRRVRALFEVFQQHLADNTCWVSLRLQEQRFPAYCAISQQAYTKVLEEITVRAPGLTDEDVATMAQSLVMDAEARAGGVLGYDFAYIAQESVGCWRLLLTPGFESVGCADHPRKLGPLKVAHQRLCEVLPTSDAFKELSAARTLALEAVGQFKDSLDPDPRLWKLLLNGRCQ